MCVPCYDKEGHYHRMEKLGFDLDDGNNDGDSKTNPQESRRLSIQRCIQSLVHACQCRDANCRLPSCQKMKRVVAHTKTCKRKTTGGCAICKQLIALCCYHAKHCQEGKCPVPFCPNIKQKLRQQQLQTRLQQAQMLRRRMATMQTHRTNVKEVGFVFSCVKIKLPMVLSEDLLTLHIYIYIYITIHFGFFPATAATTTAGVATAATTWWAVEC